MHKSNIKGNIVDVLRERIYSGFVESENGKIIKIGRVQDEPDETLPFILPGFIDSHVHIESSMLIPSEFARLAVVHGTVATVSDPHEIANVCGVEGVAYMIENGRKVPFKFNFGAPSCVPATVFETAGATLGVSEVAALLQHPEIKYLSEMMNFPGVLMNDPEVMQKIKAAHDLGKPVDGHAPGLRGADAEQYAKGIAAVNLPGTDHECFTKEEALDKLQAGMKILIREGSAAKNFEALIDLLNDYPDDIMFCSDDKHPDSLAAGHINQLCARAVAKGISVFKVLKAACINPVLHYKLDVGLFEEGAAADFIVVKDLNHFEVLQTFINGTLVAEQGKTLIAPVAASIINNFNCAPRTPDFFALPSDGSKTIPVIEALDGQLITHQLLLEPKVVDGFYVSDVERDILKMVVVNRYTDAKVAGAFVRNFGIKQGAIASSVAHDSHNIIAVGVDDESISRAVNKLIAAKGGVSAVAGAEEQLIPLPVAGLMSNANGYEVAAAYTQIDAMAKKIGSGLAAPFMTLSFMALLVIPDLKLSDKGLFDGRRFELIGPKS
ncbi:MAG: adenine deaminase [Niabella sp.]|nr:adenine deaminase [Niabella sp.]